MYDWAMILGISAHSSTMDQSPGLCSVHVPPLHQCGVHRLYSHVGGLLSCPIAAGPVPPFLQDEVCLEWF